MSFLRTRSKIAVTIPPKRRPTVPPVQPPSEPDVKEVKPTTSDPPAGSSETPEANKTSAPNESKTFFKRIKPAVQVRSRARATCIDNEKPEPSHEVISPKKEQIVPPQELKVNEERPVTPPPQVPVISSPAKSPARHRFARPATTDSTTRRHSVHASSASESEDDGRRNTASRMRKLSESSVFSKVVEEQVVDDPGDENECVRLALLPKKRKAKVSNHVRKIAEARRNFNRRFCKDIPDRSNLKMFDLLFYNPNTPDENKVPSAEPEIKPSNVEQILREEVVDDPECKEEQEIPDTAMPVPQVKIGANGEIILDEKSLVIETTDARKCREAMKNTVPIFEDKLKRSCYYGKKHSKPKDWSPVELKCFYKALNSIGTDFALMEALFPGRSRAQLKNKFKREEKVNKALIEKALSKPASFNIATLKEEFETERALVEKETQRRLQEIQQLAQERKANLARDSKQDTIPHQRFDGIEFHGLTRRSKRKSVVRKLSSEFVDSFDSDGNEPPSPKKAKDSADTEQPASSEKDIPNEELFQVFKTNLENMQTTTVTIQPPADATETVQLVIDAQEQQPEETVPQATVYFLQDEQNTVEPMQTNEQVTENVITDGEVSHRTIGGFNYFLFKNDKESFESQVQELKAGSIVVMFSNTPEIPLENRLSTFMMVDKLSDDGVSVSAMPALLPPELRELVLSDFIQS